VSVQTMHQVIEYTAFSGYSAEIENAARRGVVSAGQVAHYLGLQLPCQHEAVANP